MPKRKNFICCLRKPGKLPNGHVCRRDDDKITIVYEYLLSGGKYRQFMVLPQKDARLIAKRINEFLDGGG